MVLGVSFFLASVGILKGKGIRYYFVIRSSRFKLYNIILI